MYLVMEHLCSVGAILMALPEEANRQEIMHGGKEVTAMPTVRKGVASAQTETVCSVSGREQSETVREREREGKRVRACVAYSVSFFLASRIEMCVSGVGNEPQREEQRGEGAGLFVRSNHIGRTTAAEEGRRKARAFSLSLSVALFLESVRPSVAGSAFPARPLLLSLPAASATTFFASAGALPLSLSLSLVLLPPPFAFPSEKREESGD